MSASDTLAGVILAAGASSRMGRDKALLAVPGTQETFLDRLLRLLAAPCSPLIVVLGRRAEEIRAGLERPGDAIFVVNPEPERGQLSSLQCGLRAVPPAARGVMFTPVDYPHIAEDTIARLAAEFRAARAPLIIPRCGGRHGHPVCCARELMAELLALPEDSQAREVIHRHAGETCYIDVEDAGILRDVDDPQAYRELATPR